MLPAGSLDEGDVLRLRDVTAAPGNMTCSKRCAKPVLPGCSCLLPTSYQSLTATTGTRWFLADQEAKPVARRSSV